MIQSIGACNPISANAANKSLTQSVKAQPSFQKENPKEAKPKGMNLTWKLLIAGGIGELLCCMLDLLMDKKPNLSSLDPLSSSNLDKELEDIAKNGIAGVAKAVK